MLKPVVKSVMTGNNTLMSLVILSITVFAFAQAPEWQWATQAGGTASDYARSITLDDAENSYITGYFSGTATFDSTSLTSIGENDIFVAKLDTNGNWQWATQAGGLSYDYSYSINLDDAGNSYITGSFWETATFGSHTLTSSYDRNIFVAKLDAGGNWQWAIQAGGSGSDKAYSLSSDESGNSYILGRFQDTATFGSTSLTSSGPDDIFVAKLDTNGNWLWATQAGGTSGNFPHSISLDEAGNSYITGVFEIAANFGSTSLTSNYKDTFVAKLSANGNWQWATQVVGDGFDSGYSITLDEADNSYITGVFHDTATFGSTSLTSIGWSDIYVAKLDSYGNWQWATQAGGDVGSHTNEIGFSIKLDEAGNSYITGQFSETAAFGSTYLTSSGQDEIFVAKLDTNGNWQWATQAGGTASDYARSIVLGEAGNYYIAGFFPGTATFGSSSLTSDDDFDIFVAKLDYTIIADFTSDQTSVLLGNEIQFTDLSTNNPNSWAWDFDNDGITDSFEQNPNYTYLDIGNYSVPLTVSNEYTSDTEFKTDYINVWENSTPFIVNPISDFAFEEDTVNNSIDLNSVFDDPDIIFGDELTFSFSGNASIAVEIVSGIVTLTPSQDWNGIETITFTATDNFLEQISDDVVVTIIPVNDAPWFTSIPATSVLEGELYSYTATAEDIENDALTFAATVLPTWLTFTPAIGLLTGIPTNSEVGDHNITITVTDDSIPNPIEQSFVITVTNVNNPPEINFPAEFQFEEDLSSTYDFTQYITDIDNGYEELTLTWEGNDIIDIINDNWDVTFSSNTENWYGEEVVTFYVDDGVMRTKSQFVSRQDSRGTTKENKKHNKLTVFENHRDIVSESRTVYCLSVNDPPELISWSPEELEFTVYQDSTVTFIGEAFDVDSELIYDWFLNSVLIEDEVDSFYTHTFEVIGDSDIESIIYDEENQIGQSWLVHVIELVEADDNVIPQVTKLHQNYPNPFNPITTIEFSVMNNSQVELLIYNIKGHKIKSLLNDQITLGEHSIVWDGEDDSGKKVGSGVYFYSLNVNGKIEAVKKCLFLK